MTPTGTPLPPQRELFEVPREVAYFNCANMSPQLRAVTDAGEQAVRRRREPWTISPADWFTGVEALRARAAHLLGVNADGVALVSGVSYGIAVAAANIVLRRGETIVLLEEQFPSNVYSWHTRARETGARVVTVKRPADGAAWTDAILAAIESRTGVVAVPPCHWTDGSLVDLVRVGERARAVGAALVVDASQWFGAAPLDLAAIQPDFLVSVGYKWQLGPYGLGYLYVAPRWREEGRPLEESWLSRASAEDFARLTDYRMDYRPGARRFDMGEYPQFVNAPMALAALSQLAEWTVERVATTLGDITGRIAREAEALGCAVQPVGQRARHMVGIRRPGGIPDGLPARLAAQRVHVSVRGDAIRIAPHVYNDEEDVARLLAVLKACL